MKRPGLSVKNEADYNTVMETWYVCQSPTNTSYVLPLLFIKASHFNTMILIYECECTSHKK